MSETDLQFTPTEAQIVARADHPEITRRRIRSCIAVPLLSIALILIVFWRDAQPRIFFWMFVVYIIINMFEKVGYGLAVLSYKSVIRKLQARIAELESRNPGR